MCSIGRQVSEGGVEYSVTERINGLTGSVSMMYRDRGRSNWFASQSDLVSAWTLAMMLVYTGLGGLSIDDRRSTTTQICYLRSGVTTRSCGVLGTGEGGGAKAMMCVCPLPDFFIGRGRTLPEIKMPSSGVINA